MKIFEGELDMDKHIEDIHFLEILNEEDDEDGEDDTVYDSWISKFGFTAVNVPKNIY